MQFFLGNHRVERGDTPLVMGILNVTPDSFSDGGCFLGHTEALARGQAMIGEGADILDVGPESTRPGAQEVGAEEQIARAIPVINALRAVNASQVISIDTRLAGVARAAIDAGADMINDVSALRDDPGMCELVACSNATVVLMHRKGTPPSMQTGGGPHYNAVIGEICEFLSERARFAEAHGIDPSRVVIDPGIGFGKRIEHNLSILKHLDRFTALGRPVLVGASRKQFIGMVAGEANPSAIDNPRQRLAGSLACAAIAALAGAAIIRTHDVRATVEVVRLCRAVDLSS